MVLPLAHFERVTHSHLLALSETTDADRVLNPGWLGGGLPADLLCKSPAWGWCLSRQDTRPCGQGGTLRFDLKSSGAKRYTVLLHREGALRIGMREHQQETGLGPAGAGACWAQGRRLTARQAGSPSRCCGCCYFPAREVTAPSSSLRCDVCCQRLFRCPGEDGRAG